MTGKSPLDRDELLVTGIPPVADPLREAPLDETQVETEPVFVDSTGWRARLGRRLGLAAGAVLVVFLGALGLGMATGPDVPLTPWSDPSPRPRVKLSAPDVPTEKPGERRAAGSQDPTGRVESPAPSASSAPTADPSPRQGPPTSTTAPGKSDASPPAWGRKRKDR